MDLKNSEINHNCLIENEKLYRLIAENSFDMICLIDAEGRYKYANNSYTDILGYSKAEVLATKPFGFVHPEDLEFSISSFKKALESDRKEATIVIRLICKDGTYKWIEHRGKALYNENGDFEIILINAQDVTQRKYQEEQIIKAKEEAESANIAKTKFLANISHELRTPLSSIIGFTDILYNTPLDADQEEYLEILKKSSSLLKSIIDDTIDLSKIESGKLELSTENIEPEPLLMEIFSSFEPAAKEKGIEFNMEIDSKIPDLVTVDPLRLRQILINLTSNALKFTDSGKVLLSVKLVKMYHAADMGKFRISIEDTGIGIESDKIGKVTESFFQADSSSSRKYSGSGLGLAITDKLLKMMGSKLEISSTEGKGSVFSFNIELPSFYTDEKGDTNNEKSFNIDHIHIRKALVVDDNPLNRFLASKILSLAVPGTEIFLAEDGHSAFRQCLEHHPELILLDIHMPDMNGFEVAKKIRESGITETKIIAVTADVIECNNATCKDTEIDGYVSKPFSKKDLLAEIKRVFNR